MRQGYLSRDGFVLMRSANVRQQAARRRTAVICAMVALALTGAAIGAMHPSPAETRHTTTGPFSYFPSE